MLHLSDTNFGDYAFRICDYDSNEITVYSGIPTVEVAYQNGIAQLQLNENAEDDFIQELEKIMKENPCLYYRVTVSALVNNHISDLHVDMLEKYIITKNSQYANYLESGAYDEGYPNYRWDAYMMADYSSGKFHVEFLNWQPYDTDLNGSIGVSDIVALQKFLLGAGTFSNQAALNADINADGSVDGFDLAKLKRYVLKRISK